MFKKIREYENLHIALWLLKDTCWVMSWHTAGMIMIIPTLAVAIHIAWKSRTQLDDLFHNIAVCLWITANAIWMTGEFFYEDGTRKYATVFFALGIIVVAAYYAVYVPKRLRAERELANSVKTVEETTV
ncbi:MAG: hypothetical protein JWO06_860 [Bacteroidota bacterium]|nr:hypothetical protein [Bacteroidota bacterium]